MLMSRPAWHDPTKWIFSEIFIAIAPPPTEPKKKISRSTNGTRLNQHAGTRIMTTEDHTVTSGLIGRTTPLTMAAPRMTTMPLSIDPPDSHCSLTGSSSGLSTLTPPPCCILGYSICYDGIDIRKRRDCMLALCHHLFHRECLSQWMDVKMECPICRTELPAL
jgi:Ring finger domain